MKILPHHIISEMVKDDALFGFLLGVGIVCFIVCIIGLLRLCLLALRASLRAWKCRSEKRRQERELVWLLGSEQTRIIERVQRELCDVLKERRASLDAAARLGRPKDL